MSETGVSIGETPYESMLGIITRRRILYWIARLLNRSEELLHLLPPVVTTRLHERRLVKAIRGTTTTAETPLPSEEEGWFGKR